MATILYLNDTQVFPDCSQTIRITRENPYFTESESYTLEVTLPTSILENRQFFGNIQRMDCTKHIETMSCRLIANNRPVLSGSARVTQVTDTSVKVQLLGGRSEVNFLSSENKDYIDEMDLGTVISTRAGTTISGRVIWSYHLSSGLRIKSTPVYDETNQSCGETRQLCLIDLMSFCIRHYGFTLERNDIDVSPWNNIYIATALATRVIRHTLPHWTVNEFLKEACRFFNVTIYTDQINKTASIVSNVGLPGSGIVSLTPVDEYTADMSEEESECIANDTLEFQLSDSEHHEYDMIDSELRSVITRQSYASRAEALQAWLSMGAADRAVRVFTTEAEGDYASWLHNFNWKNQNPPSEQFTKIDVFAPLSRGANTMNLKIVPVAIGYIYEEIERDGGVYKNWWAVPSMSNSYPREGYGQPLGGRRGASSGSQSGDGTSVQEYIEGSGIQEETGKEDRMQVMFVDETSQTYGAYYTSIRDTWEEYTGSVGFTDADLKPQFAGETHQPWSLSLNPTHATYYLGLLHRNGYSFNTKAKNAIKFVSDVLPDPRSIFLIRNKRYGCEKIEASVSADGLERLMTGYFYEML